MPWKAVYSAVALTTMGLLILELSLTRIFSVIFYYHFGFLAISIALFGLGAGGVFSYALARRGGSIFPRLGWLSLANSVSVVVALAVLLIPQGETDTRRLAAVYFATSLPFFLGGAVLSLAISETVERVNRVYFFDLLGAAAGCLALVPLLDTLGGPGTTLTAATLFALAAAIWHHVAGGRFGAWMSGVAAAALIIFVSYNTSARVLDVTFAKGARLTDEIFVKWNSFSRISVRWEKAWPGPAIVIDADANTGISGENPPAWPEGAQFEGLRQSGPSFVYLLRPRAKTMIIGPGGGLDVAAALKSGSRDVTGVEINPIIANTIMRQRFAAVSKNLYQNPWVHIVVEDGRSFVRRSREKYQVLQATLVDTWASTAAGAFALSENSLYTTDAFRDYLTHMTDDGVMSFTRWGFSPPRESLRLVALAVDALEQLGEREAWRHILIAREGTKQDLAGSGAQDTVLISRKPFTPADLALARRAFKPLEAVYVPGDAIPNEFTQFLHSADRAQFFRNYRYDASPVSDDRPFFFYTVQPRDLRAFLTGSQAAIDYKINRAVPMLFSVMGVSIVATLLVLLLPPLLAGARLPREPGVARFLLYFAAIGAGYILIEVALIQRLVLFLGHPTYALTVVIFGMLLSSGAGSYFSGRVSRGKAPILAAGAVVVLAGVVSLALTVGVGWPLWIRILVTVAMIAPAGFIMGMPFPQGLAALNEWHAPSVRWAWSLNAASSVLGSASAIFCAIYAGLRATLLFGAALYVVAWYVARLANSRSVSSHTSTIASNRV